MTRFCSFMMTMTMFSNIQAMETKEIGRSEKPPGHKDKRKTVEWMMKHI